MRQSPPPGKRTWKPDEEEYLMEKWGQVSIPAIANKLNRTTNAVKIRAHRLGLGAVLMAGEYVTLNQLLAAATGSDKSYSYKMKSWVENRGMPVHTKKVDRCSFRVVYIDEFWSWAEKNRSFIDFSKMEPMALGMEPDWVTEQRKKDFDAYAIQRKDPWSEVEDSRLKMLLSKHRYSWVEISEMMHRSHGALARAGATKIMVDYESGKPTAVTFAIETVAGTRGFRLPAAVDGTLRVFAAQKIKADRAQAERTAWRNIRDWVLAQLALVESCDVAVDEVFFPYLTDKNGRTLYQAYATGQFMLEGSNG